MPRLRRPPHSAGRPAPRNGPRSQAPSVRLVPIRLVLVHHRLGPDEQGATRQPACVQILIGEDGEPLTATIISGPAFLYEEALAAARQWRSEPLAPHGFKGPQALTPHFFPLLER